MSAAVINLPLRFKKLIVSTVSYKYLRMTYQIIKSKKIIVAVLKFKLMQEKLKIYHQMIIKKFQQRPIFKFGTNI